MTTGIQELFFQFESYSRTPGQGRILDSLMRSSGLSGKERTPKKRRISRALDQVGRRGANDQKIFELSGGEQQRWA
jgi:ABC-type Mn2+/Zn2+ transport system ATPase subunit